MHNNVFIGFDGADYLHVLSGATITGPCDVPVRESLEKGDVRREGAYGGVGRFMINVNECSLHIREDLNRVLKLLTDIMCFPQRCACVHDDVDLNEIIWATLSYGIL